MKTEPVITSTSTIFLEDGVLHVVAHAGTTETLETATAAFEKMKEVTGGVPRPLLLDIRHARGIERPARQLYTSRENNLLFSVSAIIVKGGVSRAIANFILGVIQPNHPIRLFTSTPEALAWLKKVAP